MKPQAYEMLAARESTYWWHLARRHLVLGLLRKYGISTSPRWLDLGCGTGGNLAMLDALSPALVVGTDLSPIAMAFASKKAPHASIVGADISRTLPYADASFDVVTIFNVLCHNWIKDETEVLAECRRVLRPGGLLLVTEPAFPSLAREMDVLAMAHRRYLCSGFEQICSDAGFKPLRSSYFTSFGFPLLLGMKLLRAFRSKTEDDAASAPDMKPLPAVVDKMMYGLARTEGLLIERGINVPLGTTLICVARKP